MTTYYVDPVALGDDTGESWDDAFLDIADGLSACSSGDELWCKARLITLTAELEISAGISVYGGFDTALTGTSGSVAGRESNRYTYINGDGTYRGFVLTDDTIVLDGFTINNCDGTNGGGIAIEGGASTYSYGSQLLTDGDMDTNTTSAWSSSSATLTKDTDDPKAGPRCLKVTATASEGYAYQTIMTIGNTYKVSGYAEAGGENSAMVECGSTNLVTIYDGSWTYFNDVFVADSTQLRLVATDDGDLDYSFFDEISVRELVENSGAIDDITIKNCVILNSSATTGGGIYIEDATDVTIDTVSLAGCTATNGGGIGIEGECTAVVTDSRIVTCEADTNGGGIYLNGDDSSNSYTIKNTFFYGNEATSGANIYESDDASADLALNRCVIADGVATTCGGMLATSADTVMTNCTIADNDDTGLERTGGSLVAVNCIVWDNDTQISGTVTITYSNVEGSYSGTGNKNDDPLFRGDSNYLLKYDLSGLSDAIDSGNSGATGFLSTDIRARSMYDHPDKANAGIGTPAYSDMGAYEYQGTPSNTMSMSNYYIDCSQAGTVDDYIFRKCVLLVTPRIPTNFRQGATGDNYNAAHKISSEIEIDENDSTLEEWVTIGDILSAHRSTAVGTQYTSPTRDADYDDETKSSDDDHVADDPNHHSGHHHKYPGLEKHIQFLCIKLKWQPYVEDAGDALRIFNVDLEQVFDTEYSYGDFCSAAHPATTLIAPDMPLSAWHIKYVLQNSLLRILYETRNIFSVPVYGVYKQPVV